MTWASGLEAGRRGCRPHCRGHRTETASKRLLPLPTGPGQDRWCALASASCRGRAGGGQDVEQQQRSCCVRCGTVRTGGGAPWRRRSRMAGDWPGPTVATSGRGQRPLLDPGQPRALPTRPHRLLVRTRPTGQRTVGQGRGRLDHEPAGGQRPHPQPRRHQRGEQARQAKDSESNATTG